MKVLVATTKTQGIRSTDYCGTVEGELVRLPGMACNCPDCGCGHGWAGLASSRATTTAMVAELHLDRDDLTHAFTSALERDGWVVPGEDRTWITEFVEDHLMLATAFPVGTILELTDGELVSPRVTAA